MSPVALATIAAAPFVGSFVGLLADRLPRGEGVVYGRSRCDGCGRPLAARDLAPLLSYAAAGGRARCCAARLRPALPAVEAGAVALACWAAVVTQGPLIPASAALGWTLLALALIDARTFRLPDALTLPLLLAGIGLGAVGLTGSPASQALGAALGFGVFRGVGAAYRRFRGLDGLGLGDAKLLGAAGAWVGPSGLPSVLAIACAGALGGAALCALVRGGIAWRAPIPFGPALAAGLWLTWLYGPIVMAPPT